MLLCLLLTTALAGPFDTPLTGWTYHTASPPLAEQYADPGGRLTDGESSGSKAAIWRDGSVHLDLTLPQPAKLTGIRVHQHRGNTNYKLDHLSVMVEQAGQWIEAARSPITFFGPTPERNFTHELDLGGQVTSRVRLYFAAVGVLSLSEVELFGTPVAQLTAGGAFANVPFAKAGAPIAKEADLDGDGQVELVLENADVRLILAPAEGGVVKSLRLKPDGQELVHSPSSGYGLLRDQLWEPNYSFGDRFYFHRLDNGPNEASVELWTTGVGGMMGFTEIRKRLTLGSHGAAVAVHYTLTNQPSSQTTFEYGFWSHNWTGAPGQTNTYYDPTTDGVQTFLLDDAARAKSHDVWYRNPARGWTAVLAADGSGLAITLPYKYLNLYYHWSGAGSLAATHEVRFNRIELAAGDKLEWDLKLLPFGPDAKLKQISGVVDTVVGGIDVHPGGDGVQANAAFTNLDHGSPCVARIRLTTLPDRQPTNHDPLELKLGDGTLEADWSAKPGTYAVGATIERAGKAVGTIEAPVAVGGGRLIFHVEPESERVGEGEQATAKDLYALRDDVVTPHVPWARPLPGGPIKALVLMDDLNAREAIELSERVDMTVDYVKFRTNRDKELRYQGDQSILTLDAARAALAQKLAANEYDVMVIAGFDWSFHFTPEIREAILGQVDHGAGLVVIQPDGIDETTNQQVPALGVAEAGDKARHMNQWFDWHSPGDHPLTAGLDWNQFPPTRRHNYRIPPAGEAIATSGRDNAPLVTLGKLGQGRVVSCTWDTLTHTMSYRGYSALTPILSYRGGWLRPEFADLPAWYHETWFALLARLVPWAAGRDSGVQVANAEPLEQVYGATAMPTFEVTSAAARPQAKAEWYQLDPHHAGLGTRPYATAPVALTAGTNSLTAPGEPPGGGRWMYALVVREQGGAALASGFTTVTVEPVARIASIEATPSMLLPEGGVWHEDEPVETPVFQAAGQVQVSLKLDPAPVTKGVMEVRLTDAHSRLLKVVRADLPASEAAPGVSIPLPPLLEQGIEAAVRIGPSFDAPAWDVRIVRVTAQRPRVWNRFWYTSWSGNWLWRSHYLFDFNTQRVRDWGLDVAFEGETELSTGRVADQAWHSIDHSWLGMLLHLGQGVASFPDDDFAKKSAEYAKTKDPKYLEREPCLVDPAWRQAALDKIRERTQRTMDEGGTYDYCMGDEMSLTYYTRFHDFDWSSASLADFRRWLQTRYASLDALNQSWSSSHATWDAVMPQTREQAQASDNPAAWAEFRTYMNHQLADFYADVQRTIRAVDPHAHAGLSGTQSPEAANGMDWWTLRNAFSYHHSYNTSWSNEMRRSFQYLGGAEQSPYFSGYSATDPWVENRFWWCLLHDTRGISAWKTGLFFYGDFSETPSGRDTQRALNEMRSGIWRVVRRAKRQNDKVAIVYSMPSILAGALSGKETAINDHRDAWVKLLEDDGLQYEFVASEQIEAGELIESGYRAVVLPYTLAMSQAEAKAYHEFVAGGGTILASRPVARYDELCRPRDPGLLDDLFGIQVEGAERAVEPTIKLAGGPELRLPVAATNLILAGGEAMGSAGEPSVPALIKASGGRAVMLNIDLSDFESERKFQSPTEARLKQLLLGFLADAGVTPKYPITLALGKPSQIEQVRYDLPGVELLGLLNSRNEACVATIPLGGAKQVYDVRAGADLGRIETLTVPVEAMRARLFAIADVPLPAPTVKVAAAAPAAAQAGTIPVVVGRTASSPTPQLIRLTVTAPDGAEQHDRQQTVWVTGDPVAAELWFSPSDSAGTWRVTATDVLSGQTATAGIQR